MSAVIVSYRLKPGVAPADFEAWVHATDHPTLRGFARVKAMDTFRVERPLLGGEAPGVDYVELIHIPDLAGFMADEFTGEAMQAIMGQFAGFVEAPQFWVAEKL